MEKIYIPTNNDIDEQNIYIDFNDLSIMLKKYKNEPEKIIFIAEMLED